MSGIKGEARTGFEKHNSKGPFNCGNCRYYDDGGCDQPAMMRHSKQPRLKDGAVSVSADDCCEYVDRTGKRKG